MSNFEKKFGKYAVSNLSLKLVILYVIGYVLYFVKPDIFSLLVLDVTALMNGQIWRLFSWLLVPPESGSNFLFVAIMLYFYYSIGTSLERVWGDYKYNVYIFLGIILTILSAFFSLSGSETCRGSWASQPRITLLSSSAAMRQKRSSG